MSLSDHLHFICDANGEKQSLVVPMEALRKLIESYVDKRIDTDEDWSKAVVPDDFLLYLERLLEDYIDIKTIESRRLEPTLSFEQVRDLLEHDGKL